MIDIVFCILLFWGTYQGYRKGLIKALFSVLGFFVALAAATKLSSVVAAYLSSHFKEQYVWMPLLSFVLVFAIVILLFLFIGKLLQKTGEVVMLGWLNRLGGILIYIFIYTTAMSVVLFYLTKMNVLSESILRSSFAYPLLQPFGPLVVEKLSYVLPFLKGCFEQLSFYFEQTAKKLN